MQLAKFLSAFSLILFIGLTHAQNGDGSYETTTAPEHNEFFAGFGPATINNLESDDLSYQFHLGKLWGYSENLALKALAQATTDFDGSVLTSGNVGANYYLFDADYKPYLGGLVGLGYGRDQNDEDGVGIDLGAQLGVELLEIANTKVNVETGANWLFNEISEDSSPLTIFGRVGVLF